MYLKLAELGFQDTLLRGTVVVTDKSHTLGYVGSNPTWGANMVANYHLPNICHDKVLYDKSVGYMRTLKVDDAA